MDISVSMIMCFLLFGYLVVYLFRVCTRSQNSFEHLPLISLKQRINGNILTYDEQGPIIYIVPVGRDLDTGDLVFKLGTVFLLFIASSVVSAEKLTYLVNSHDHQGHLISGAAFADTNRREVEGYIFYEDGTKGLIYGNWTRRGKIEAVDPHGNMYVFDVIRELRNVVRSSFDRLSVH